ncbi:hypothetical protein ABH931_004135 [Streptacidiphilus sp. MAP12-33]|uniref:hypothetical protein n=1 Tax=Streptacidiphilus sp. MAP12-33 TaxID=3156266 RepID=UPI0035184EC0
MANSNWSVRYTNVDVAIDPNAPVPLGGKLVSSLTSAMADASASQWIFEIDGEPVATFEEFQRLYVEAPTVGPAEFIARAPGVVVESA